MNSSNSNYKKILLISEALPNENQRGISQTIYNLLKFYPREQMILCKPLHERRNHLVQSPFDRKIFNYKINFIPYFHKFYKTSIYSFLTIINLFLCKLHTSRLIEQIKKESPDVILLLAMSYDSVYVCYEIYKKINTKLVIYLMDDWMYEIPNSSYKEKLDIKMAFLLGHSNGWIMISKYLTDAMIQRYQITKPNVLLAHNPVAENIIAKESEFAKNAPYSVIYAGSIWPMHFDALELTAKAIYYIQNKGIDICLKIYCPLEFWNNYQNIFTSLNVKYEGNKTYKEIHGYLQQADLLVVCSSFQERYKGFSLSSVQTKITDYMAALKPILSVGPRYSACNQFIIDNDCGVVCDEYDEQVCASQILNFLSDIHLIAQKVENGHQILIQSHSEKVVQNKLNMFLTNL